MKQTYILGLTGQMAAGKSTVAAVLKDLGAYIISADAINHELQRVGTPQTQVIAAAFGDVLEDSGGVDRAKLRQVLQENPEKIAILNEIMHPAIRAEMVRRIDEAKETGEKLVVVEVPLMFQTGAEVLCDGVLAVVAAKDVRLARAQQRTPQLTEQEFEMLDGRQLGEAVLREKADFVIDGGMRLDEVQTQIHKFAAEFMIR